MSGSYGHWACLIVLGGLDTNYSFRPLVFYNENHMVAMYGYKASNIGCDTYLSSMLIKYDWIILF
jgi:hypothetical protein